MKAGAPAFVKTLSDRANDETVAGKTSAGNPVVSLDQLSAAVPDDLERLDDLLGQPRVSRWLG